MEKMTKLFDFQESKSKENKKQEETEYQTEQVSQVEKLPE